MNKQRNFQKIATARRRRFSELAAAVAVSLTFAAAYPAEAACTMRQFTEKYIKTGNKDQAERFCNDSVTGSSCSLARIQDLIDEEADDASITIPTRIVEQKIIDTIAKEVSAQCN